MGQLFYILFDYYKFRVKKKQRKHLVVVISPIVSRKLRFSTFQTTIVLISVARKFSCLPGKFIALGVVRACSLVAMAGTFSLLLAEAKRNYTLLLLLLLPPIFWLMSFEFQQQRRGVDRECFTRISFWLARLLSAKFGKTTFNAFLNLNKFINGCLFVKLSISFFVSCYLSYFGGDVDVVDISCFHSPLPELLIRRIVFCVF